METAGAEWLVHCYRWLYGFQIPWVSLQLLAKKEYKNERPTNNDIPAQSIPGNVTVMGIVLVAIAGTFLPVPMAFDVAIAFILMVRGVPLPYVVTLLCTLGAFSIYSVLILGRTMSWRIAASLFGAVMLLGIAAGIGTGFLQHSF